MNKIITISRQFGSGGRTIGKETAKKLGIPCYDKESNFGACRERVMCYCRKMCRFFTERQGRLSGCIIYASKEFRADRIVNLYGESSFSPEKRLAEKDRKRKLNYKYFTNQEWGKTENYDGKKQQSY